MKPLWRKYAAPGKCALLFFALFTTTRADTLNPNVLGSGSLRSLLQNGPVHTLPQKAELAQKQPYFILTPSYSGSISLGYHRGALEEAADKKRDIHFVAFTRVTRFYDECDCPLPRVPTIFEFVNDVSGEVTYGEFAFFCKSLPSVERLSECRTVNELKSEAPKLVKIFDEDDPHAGYWYNWFKLSDDGQIDVVFLTASHDTGGKLPQMEIWKGRLRPYEKNAGEAFAPTDNMSEGRLIRAAADTQAHSHAQPQYVKISGDGVRTPAKIRFSSGLTLLGAISAAGGSSGNPNVYIIRGKDRTRIRLKPILRRQAPDPVLLPGDQIELLDGTI